MKTIRSQKLILKSGRERIYELDLVELDRSSDSRFLVNYRYGWSGKELLEGTRTPDPVSRDAADKIFDSLVLSRQNQGYGTATGAEAWQTSSVAGATLGVREVGEGVEHPRTARLMVLLGRLSKLPDIASAKLIWRTGQLRLAAAAPILAGYFRDAEESAARVLPYALYRCGHASPDVVAPALRHLGVSSDPAVAVPSAIALSLLSPREAEASRLRAGLPEAVSVALSDDDLDSALTRVLDYLGIAVAAASQRKQTDKSHGLAQQQALIDLYLLSHHAPQTRPLFLKVLEQVPFQPFLFRAVRRVFKAAEAVDDAEVFSVFCHRFDVVAPAVRSGFDSFFVQALGRYMSREEAFGKDDTRVAWSDRTRAYFRRRIWRHLRRIGLLDDVNYVELATACLMRADESKAPPTSKTRWDWGGSSGAQQIQIHYPAMSRYFAVHHILHGSGTRLAGSGGSSLNWYFTAREASGATTREEPFSKLWDDAPDRVLSLLVRAQSEQVLGFAARILSDNQPFRLALPFSVLEPLLTSKSNARFAFAYETVQAQFADGQINGEIIPALFRANRSQSIELGKTILNARSDLATENSALAAKLLFAVRDETKDWFDQFWAKHARETNAPNVIAEVIAQAGIHPWYEENLDQDKNNVRLVADLIDGHFGDAVKQAPLSSLVSLSQSVDVPPQLLAILLARKRPDGLSVFDPKVLAESEDADLQAAGAELLANADIEVLKKHEDLVAAFLISPVERARKVSRNAAIAIAEQDIDAAGRIANKLLHVLYRAEEFEGVRDDVVATMQGPLLEAVRAQGPDLTWSLLRARSEPARRVGAASLESFASSAFSLRKIARLGNNDQVKARRWSLNALEQRIGDVRAAPNEIFLLLDGDWEDSREAAYDLIRRRIVAEDWSPEAVVGLCDCTTLPAQRFGREILGQMFSKEHSEYFLMRLSEHPSAGFRLTIARLIREYAAGDPQRIRKVEPAVRTILSRVFSSRPAKEQIHSFIESEIETGNFETLDVLAGVLETVSATCAVGDKARVLGHISRLKAKAPDLLPAVKFIDPEVRSGYAGRSKQWT